MSGFAKFLFVLSMLWLGAVFQQAIADRMTILGAQPDLLLVTAISLSLCLSPKGGALTGFTAGLLHGALAGADLTHFVISRACAGFFASLIASLDIQIGLMMAGLVTAGATLIAQTLFMLLAPPANITSFIGATIEMAAYNGVLAMPSYALMRRVLVHRKI